MKKNIKAILCDLDGVLTQTAQLHARAWKLLFDEFLKQESAKSEIPFQEFEIATDYLNHVDGKPRLEGIRSFLKTRNIKVPEGTKEDLPETVTIYNLGRKKNELLHELLEKEGVEIYARSIDAIRGWKEKGIKAAVVSSSKNARQVLEAAGITHLFDVVVDGIQAEEAQLQGKPHPDTFIYAADKLNCKPLECAVAEDAMAGIEAAVSGGFGLAIGIENGNNKDLLQKAGADVVVKDLSELMFTGNTFRYPRLFENLQPAFSDEHTFGKIWEGKKPVFFFDYDGTLTPIVDRPEDAQLSPDTRKKLTRLAELAPLTIISGRDKNDVQKLVCIENLFYAGSHGFDIEGPDVTHTLGQGEDIIEAVKEITPKLQERLKKYRGVQIEPKKFAVAVHYRNASETDRPEIINATRLLTREFKNLKTGEGKMVLEVRPDMDWDKGKAMNWVAEKLNLDSDDYHHFYIGDDITDEDAFKALPENGTGILVGDHESPTYADYTMDSPGQIEQLLDEFIETLEKTSSP